MRCLHSERALTAGRTVRLRRQAPVPRRMVVRNVTVKSGKETAVARGDKVVPTGDHSSGNLRCNLILDGRPADLVRLLQLVQQDLGVSRPGVAAVVFRKQSKALGDIGSDHPVSKQTGIGRHFGSFTMITNFARTQKASGSETHQWMRLDPFPACSVKHQAFRLHHVLFDSSAIVEASRYSWNRVSSAVVQLLHDHTFHGALTANDGV
jgi:hypothetical protein